MNNSKNDAIDGDDNEISSNGYNNNLNYQNYNNYERNYNTMDNSNYNNYYGRDNDDNQMIPKLDNLMGTLSLSENSYQDNEVPINNPPQNQNVSKIPIFPKKMFYIDTASYQSTVSSDSYSDGFSPAVSQTQSPTYYGSTTNAINSFNSTTSNVPSPTFFSVTNNSNQTELLQLQLGSNFTPGTIQITKPDPPKPPAIISNEDGFVYQVQFKRTSRYYIRLPSYNQEIKLNDYVKVYADRGEDLGQVKSMITPGMFYELKNQHGRYIAKDDENIWELKYISRLASTFEKKQLATKSSEEHQVYQFANRLVSVYNLQLVIVDVEYQFDRHKLTIMYECNKRVDFREFVRDLFAEYKTRIWMQQVTNSKTSNGPSPSSVSHGISPIISPTGYGNNGQVKPMISNNYNLLTPPSNNKQLVSINYNPNQPSNNKQYSIASNNQHAYPNNYGVNYNSQLIQNKNISQSNVTLSSFNNQINYLSNNTHTTFHQNGYSNSSNNSPLMNNFVYNPQLANNSNNKFNNVSNTNNNSINGNQYEVNNNQPSNNNSGNFSNVIKQQFEWM